MQVGQWKRENKPFHELMWQPNPHGTYLRKVIRYHFPSWWSEISETLYDNGYNLAEMNEYDTQTDMPELTTEFDKTKY